MNLQVFLLVFFLLFSLALLCALCWPHHGSAQSRAAAKMRTTLHRLLKPRCPHDCPACRLVSTPSSGGGPAPLPVRPWREVKSRRGAPKRVNTEGFACPNPQAYFGIGDAEVGTRLKTPSHHVALVLTALAEGLDASAAERVFGSRQTTILTWLSRVGQHAQTFHEHLFCTLQLP
jgi:hypothetical protein